MACVDSEAAARLAGTGGRPSSWLACLVAGHLLLYQTWSTAAEQVSEQH